MSQAVLALLAAVVGAAAAIVAQAMTPIVTARTTHRAWVRDKRASLCEEFMTLIEDGRRWVADLGHDLPSEVRKSQENSVSQARYETLGDEHSHRFASMWGAVNRLQIYGSNELMEELQACINAYDMYWTAVIDRIYEMGSGEGGPISWSAVAEQRWVRELMRHLESAYQQVRRELDVG